MQALRTKIGIADGERADFPRLANRLMLDGSEGELGVLEHTIVPRGLGAPMHTHEREDEYSFVLSGRMGAEIGGETVEAGPGELVCKPRRIPHAFWNAGDEECRILELITPPQFVRYFAECAPLLSAEGEPDFAALAEIQARYELSMDFDSIGPLCERHGLAV